MLVPTSPHVELYDERNYPVRAHLRGEPISVWDYEDGPRNNPSGGQRYSLQEALDRGMIANVPARWCFQFLSRERGQIVLWTGAACNPGFRYPELFEQAAVYIATDYYERLRWIYHYDGETGKWGPTFVDRLGDEAFWRWVRPARGLNSTFALVPAQPTCVLCKKSDRLVHPELGFCPRCTASGHPQRHTEDCLRRWRWQVVQRASFLRDHPRQCQHCDGEGFITTSGGRFEPPETNACKKCVEKGKCPWCGHKLHLVVVGDAALSFGLGGDFYACDVCSWSENLELVPDYIPYVSEWCGCGEEYFMPVFFLDGEA